ncbi:MAG: response regulator [Candidatus Omnitrophica bacterium]|nr:response regulator [Candidatus Omnitrophota bacterium]
MAHYCTVRVETVTRWVREESLHAHTTAGGRYRIPIDEAIRFMREHGIPIPDELLEGQESRRVLVVDDEPDILRNVTEMLQHFPHPLDIRTENDGIAACIAMGSFRPHLLILDLKMPKMDGYAVIEKVRSDPNTKDTNILVATGYGSPENVDRAISAGADSYITKPFHMEQLLEKVGELLSLGVLARR